MVTPRQPYPPVGPDLGQAVTVAPASGAPSPVGSLDAYLAELLADQQRLVTPAARAAATYDAQPAAFRGDHFRDLIPLTTPGPGERYAFEVDLDACSGCKACVTACHSLNGLDEHESFRDVGLVLTPDAGPHLGEAAFSQTVTTACHHCADPGCLNGCPVLAYEQDPATGIVRHLDDQCIGCSYCVLKCPYDVPKYNERLGIVRKCDMCHGRLAAGEAPACAQACPTHAIRIVTIPAPGNAEPQLGLLASAAVPPSSITRPTTRYVSKKQLPQSLRAADADTLSVQPAHWPLVLLLVGTQLSLGLLLASPLSPGFTLLAPASAALFAAALAASVAHLGQPLRAWRVFLGLRRSWLSREAVVLGAAFPLVALTASLPYLSSLPLPAPFVTFASALGPWSLVIGHSGLVLMTLGVISSGMLYIDTHRHFWRPSNTAARMAGTVLVSALAFLSAPAAALALTLKLLLEHVLLRASPISARLHAGPLRRVHHTRLALGLLSLPLFFLHPLPALLAFAAGELAERLLYFRAVDSPKMPGVPA
jgi:Fe-S-cluster-containing dehydrogenase component/DMSO reductase anchor subunit